MSQLEELTALVGNEQVRTDPETRQAYGQDESLAKPCMPEAVVFPGSSEQVQAIVQWANRWTVPLVPVSSGPPRFRGDTVPSLGGVVLDLQNMKKIVRIDRKNRVCLVEPGLTFGELLPELAKQGLRPNMPLHPRATKSVVASVLEREAPLIPRYHWDASDPMCCMEVIFGTGELFWTGEAAGPGDLDKQWEHGGAQKFPLGPHQVDYHRLIQGAQGTMGIVTWASMKCEVLPEKWKLFRFSADRLDVLLPFVYKVIRHEIGDEILFLNGLQLACLARENAEEIRSLASALPEWNLLVRLSGTRYMPEERISYQSQDLMDLAQEHGLNATPWTGEIRDDSLVRAITSPCEDTFWKLRYKGAFQELLFQSTIDHTPHLLSVAKESLIEQGVVLPDVGIYIQPLVQGTSCQVELCMFYDPGNRAQSRAVANAMRNTARDLLKAGAFFSRPYYPWASLVYETQAAYRETLKKIKNVFDPNNVFNPGKLCF